MKTMNKYFKVILCFIAFVICSFMIVLSPSITAVSAMEKAMAEYDMAIKSIQMPTKVSPNSKNVKEQKFLTVMDMVI